MTLTKSHNGTVYAGTELVLTLDISFNGFKSLRVDVNISIIIKWHRGINSNSFTQLDNDTRTVSALTDSEGSFRASLTYSPIAISDSGRHWPTVSVKPSDKSIHIKSSMSSARVDLIVEGD